MSGTGMPWMPSSPPVKAVPPIDDRPDEGAQGDLEHAEVELREADADEAHDEADQMAATKGPTTKANPGGNPILVSITAAA